MCNYCATREARKYANYVEVFLAGSQQVSTRDAVRGNLAERGIEASVLLVLLVLLVFPQSLKIVPPTRGQLDEVV